jgi:hypothetical protein
MGKWYTQEELMNEDRNQGRTVKPQQEQKHPDEYQRDLNPNHLAGQNIGQESDERVATDRTAFHLRRAGMDLGAIDDEELKQVPVLREGERLQQGATYVNLAEGRSREITARADMSAGSADAYVPKDRLIGEEKPGQERSDPMNGPPSTRDQEGRRR